MPPALSKQWPELGNPQIQLQNRGFPGRSVAKNPPAMQETRVQAVGREDSLEKETATHSSVPAWEIPWTEDPCGLQSMGLSMRSQESHTTYY